MAYHDEDQEHYTGKLLRPSPLPVIYVLDKKLRFLDSDDIYRPEREEVSGHSLHGYGLRYRDFQRASQQAGVRELLNRQGIPFLRPPYLILPDRKESELIKIVLKTDPLAMLKSKIEGNEVVNGHRYSLEDALHHYIEGDGTTHHRLQTPLQAILVFSDAKNHYKGVLDTVANPENKKGYYHPMEMFYLGQPKI